ncbi:MAG: Na-K-Cl cotransporter [Deltaproteobacteria bacterium]|nr:Na-K-Cl cotransporter [Deltaproteobacteria bacterium]
MTSPPAQPSNNGPQGLGLGWFLGVYTPTVLTILGVILYMRMGWVVGNSGVLGAMGIVLLANGITFITALSISALSTNMRVGVGGAYYIISRSLGLELGGALGIPLYLSQALSVTLYAYGLAESLRLVWPNLPVQVIAALIVIGVVLVAARSTVLALKLQLPIMLFIAVSLVALVSGIDFEVQNTPLRGEWVDGGFWQVFAVFFPAVTGVLAGVGLSGDLRDPARSIPLGVLLAVVTGFIVYGSAPWVLSHAASADQLRNNELLWTEIATGGAWFIMPGLWGAILSSAIGSILGAPRTLQALSMDRLVPAKLGEIDAETGEPMLALHISGAVALAAVALGDLNAVAGVVSMFFLTTYGMLNLAAGLEELVNDPHYRPRIRVPWWMSFIGAGGCFVAMFAINPTAFFLAVIIELGIWWYLRRRTLRAAWGDLRTGLWFAMARMSMLQLRQARHDPRNWRPHILVFSIDLSRNIDLVALASQFGQDRGIVTATTLVQADTADVEHALELRRRNVGLLKDAGLLAFTEVIAVPDLEAGFMTVAQANGFGGINSNMVVFGWPGDDADRLADMLVRSRQLASLHKSTMIVRGVQSAPPPGIKEPEIIVWWKGRAQNGDLMLLLAHLLSLSDDWRRSRITLASISSDPAAVPKVTADLRRLLESGRITASVEVLVQDPVISIVDTIHVRSREAALVFLGLAEVSAGDERAYADSIHALVDELPRAILVRNGGPFRGRLV